MKNLIVILLFVLIVFSACVKVDDDSWTITFDSQGADVVATPFQMSVIDGFEIGVLPRTPQKNEFLFEGWYTATGGGGVLFTATNVIVSAMTVYAKWVTPELRKIGAAGGYIFYVNPNAVVDGWTYLEVAPVSTEWEYKEWGATNILIAGTAIAIGSGLSNTDIVNDCLFTNNESGKAAQLCAGLSVEYGSRIYNDWFLPSKEELGKLYINLYSGTDEEGTVYTPEGGYGGNYWTSSQNSNLTNSVWRLDFNDANSYAPGKDGLGKVIAIRYSK